MHEKLLDFLLFLNRKVTYRIIDILTVISSMRHVDFLHSNHFRSGCFSDEEAAPSFYHKATKLFNTKIYAKA